MALTDNVHSGLFEVLLSRGMLEDSIVKVNKALEKLDLMLRQSKTIYFLDSETNTMADLYGWPFIARLFYLKDAPNEEFKTIYSNLTIKSNLKIHEKYPYLYVWFKAIASDPSLDGSPCEEDPSKVKISLKGRTPVKLFHAWLDDLSTCEIGKKPPLRLPLYKL